LSNALFFALISLTAAGCLDVTFKRYSRKTRSRGVYVFACGLTWCAVQAVVFSLDGRAPVFDSTNVTYGVIAGTLVVAANIILIEALTHLDISLGATIYRLNTIGVVILSFVFLSEDMGVTKILGVGLGVFSILLLYGGAPHVASSRVARLFIWAAVLASLCRAIFGVVSKAALQDGADADTLMLFAALSWVVGGLLYAAIREHPFRITRQKIGYGLVSGLLLATVANALIQALKTGDASVVAPIANLSFVIALLISAAMGAERINGRKIAAMALAAGSILLLAQAA
jgi:drug/metabolite transporter (DMT)-like permease